MLTSEQLVQALELNSQQTTVLLDFVQQGKVDAALHLAADCLGTEVDALGREDGSHLISFVRMAGHDVTTLIYDHLSKEFSTQTVAQWLEDNQDKIPSNSESDSDDDCEVSDDEPYIMFYWASGDILAAQIDGMKQLIEEQGQPDKYEIVPPPVDMF